MAKMAMIILGDDEQNLHLGEAISRGAANLAWTKLDAVYGRKNLLYLMHPNWFQVSSWLSRFKADLETFIFVGHGEPSGGIRINLEEDKNIVQPGWLKSAGGPFQFTYVYLYSCYQAGAKAKKHWLKWLGTEEKNFHGYEGAEVPSSIDSKFIMFLDDVRAAKGL